MIILNLPTQCMCSNMKKLLSFSKKQGPKGLNSVFYDLNYRDIDGTPRDTDGMMKCLCVLCVQ